MIENLDRRFCKYYCTFNTNGGKSETTSKQKEQKFVVSHVLYVSSIFFKSALRVSYSFSLTPAGQSDYYDICATNFSLRIVHE